MMTPYQRTLRRDRRDAALVRALHALATAALVLTLAGATLQLARLALGTAALDAVLARAQAERGW